MREGFGGFTQGVPDAVRRALLELKRLLDDAISTLRADVTPGAWQAATLQNGWLNYGAGWTTAAYRKEGDVVRLRGLIKSGTVNATAITLPVGHRPLSSTTFTVVTDQGLFGRIDVTNLGAVIVKSGSVNYVALDCTFAVN